MKNLEPLVSAKISAAKLDYETKLAASTNSNSSLTYKYIKSITKCSTIPSTVFYDSTSAIVLMLIRQIYSTKTTFLSPKVVDFYLVWVINYLIPIQCPNYWDTALVILDTIKETGPDEIAPVILTSCANVLYKPLCYLFSLPVQHCHIPSSWRIHKIVPIFKSGDASLLKNCRPILLLCRLGHFD